MTEARHLLSKHGLGRRVLPRGQSLDWGNGPAISIRRATLHERESCHWLRLGIGPAAALRKSMEMTRGRVGEQECVATVSGWCIRFEEMLLSKSPVDEHRTV
jgi:hypothetical protein